MGVNTSVFCEGPNIPPLTFLVEDSVRFSEKKLKLTRLKNLNLGVYVVEPKMMGKKHLLGKCINKDSPQKNPRNFNIAISRNQSKESFIKTIFHEMTHLKQFARNEIFVLREKNKILWKGDLKSWDEKELWEEEAEINEEIFYDEYMGFLKMW